MASFIRRLLRCHQRLNNKEVTGIYWIFIFFCNIVHCQSQLVLPTLGDLLRPLLPTPVSPGLEFRQREILNETANLVLEWEVDRQAETIIFNLLINLDSYGLRNEGGPIIFLGLSRTGDVLGADIVGVGGLGTASSSYLLDMYGSDNTTATVDPVQNWRLVNVQRNATSVLITVSRPLDTCDQENDIPIDGDLVRIIWGASANNWVVDNETISFIPEGSLRVYLTDPKVPSRASDALQTWRVSRRYRMPPRRTSYWCSIHRGLQLPRKHHITGFAPYFGNQMSSQHVHHQLLYRCIAPPGIDPALIFEKYVSHPGEECYLVQEHVLPTMFCTEIVHTWGLGGNSFNFPHDIGIPLGETRNEYFMFETHYDNPENRADLMVENGVDFFYSSVLRPNEGGIIFVGTGVLGLFQVPPHAASFTMAGHCSAQCTRQMLPLTGMDIVATMLHAHMSTRQVTFKNFRGNRERPWIQQDGNYDYSFQQMRLLPERVNVLPGDHMLSECVFDTRSRNSTTLSGFSTLDEMCFTFFVIKKRIPYLYCTSEFPTDWTMEMYGIRNMTWNPDIQERVVNDANNPEFIGLPLSQVVDQSVENWTPEMTVDLERQQLYGPHNATCPPVERMVMQAYAVLLADALTGGLLNGRERINAQRPSTRTVSTPGGTNPNMTAVYPVSAVKYTPDPTCVLG